MLETPRICERCGAYMKKYIDDNAEKRRENNMDSTAIYIVREYAKDHLDKTDNIPNFDVFVVWKCKVLQNWKYLLSTTLFDGMYYELTYNGDKKEWYLDAYKKFENKVIKDDDYDD